MLFPGKPSPDRRLRHANASSDFSFRFVATSEVFPELAQRRFRIRVYRGVLDAGATSGAMILQTMASVFEKPA
jgi:hypothetical protein